MRSSTGRFCCWNETTVPGLGINVSSRTEQLSVTGLAEAEVARSANQTALWASRVLASFSFPLDRPFPIGVSSTKSAEKSNQKFANMSEETYQHATALAEEIIALLKQAFVEGDPQSDLSRKLVEKHKEWLMIYWTDYSAEAHAGLGDMYVADERFKAYYDQHQAGAAEFLCEAIHAYTGA